jgi:DNA (cytosine-5)-methyltransferase 1
VKESPQLRVASFFAGIGGFDLGLERAGMKVVFQCEISAFCQRVLRARWPDVPLSEDITTLSARDIPRAQVWTGGFPCQDVSLANQGKRKGLKGERSGLFHVFAKLVSEGRPPWIILENVPGLLNSNNGEDFRTVIRTMDELGYGVSWRTFDAKYFGTPQRRRRVYIVASRGSISSAKVLFEPGTDSEVARSGLGKRDLTSNGSTPGIGSSSIYTIQHASIGRSTKAGPQAKGFRNDDETYTLDSRGSADVVCQTSTPFRVRTTSRVSKELDSNRYRAIGNAVCVPIVEWIGRKIVVASQ